MAAALSASLVVTMSSTAFAANRPAVVPAAVDGSSVVINEAYLNGGSANAPYTNKFVELYNPTSAAVSLSGWSIQYRSATGTAASNGVVPLTGSIAAGGYYLVAGGSNGANGAALPTPDASGSGLNMQGQNGTIALVQSTSAVTLPTGSVTGGNVVDLLGYGSSNTYESAAAPAGTANSSPSSLNRHSFADTNNNSADFSVSTTVTPQSTGGGSGPVDPPDPGEPGDPHTIAEIQGTGAASPLVGQNVTTRGIVTATYPTGGFNGLYIQTPGTGGDLDASHTASDAVFVFSSAAAAALHVGQYVEVTGPVTEFMGTTEITPAAGGWSVVDEAAEAVKAANVAFPADEAGREKLEGMLLDPAGDYTITDNYDTNFYGSIMLASGATPLVQPTTAGRPGSPEAAAAVADAVARRVILDDGASTNFNTAANKSIPLPYLTGGAPVRVGAAVTFTSPVIFEYRFDAWNFQPVTALTGANADAVQPATFENTRTDAPEPVGGDVTVATFNVLNYFTTTGDDLSGCQYYNDRQGNPIAISGGCDARGAANAENLARQQVKIVAAINALDADVVSLEEIENSAAFGLNRDDALSTLVDALNADAGANTWSFVPSPAAIPADEDVIRTAFIYRSAAIETVGGSTILDAPAFDNAREPLAQTFRAAGQDSSTDFVVIANHFKSKGSGSGQDADQGDGQGASNFSRIAQANALVTFANQRAAASDTTKVLLTGDFNSYEQEDPLQVILGAGYKDLGSTTGKETYVFDGLVGSLDHVFASEGAFDAVSGVDIWNINSVEPIANEYSRYNYNASILYDESPFRSSDHDPIVVGLELDGDAPVGGTKQLDLLAINDFHGRIDANTVNFAGTIEQLRAENPEGSAFISVGDNIGASLFASSLQDDQPTIDVLNALDLQASAVGNHEFDKGFADLDGRVQDAADWNYLGANVYHKGTTNPALPEYDVIDVDGVQVGVIGAVTVETPSLVTPAGIADLDFGDPVEAVNRVAAELTDGDDSNGEADVLIALYHEGATAGTPDGATIEEEVAAGGAFADIVNDTDPKVAAIFTGHTHKQYAWDAPVPGSDKTRPIIQTGNYGENIGHVGLTFDTETGEVTDYTVENVARTTTPAADLVNAYPRVAEVKTIVDEALAQANVIGAEPVGSVASDITTAFTGGSHVDGKYTGSGPLPTTGRDDRASESTLGNLVADSLKETLADPVRGGAEIGVVNAGGLRDELLYGEDGVITFAEANAVLPFVNNLWTVSLTGAQFVDLLEQQWQTDANGNRPARPFLALGLSDNVSYTTSTRDPNATPGANITSVTINGEPIDLDREYRIATFSFLATGGDNFRIFTEGTDARDSGLIDRDAWMDYLGAHPQLEPSFARRGAIAAELGTVTAGESVTADVSGLDLTSLGSPQNTAASAYLVPVGTDFDPANPGTAVATGTVAAGAVSLDAAVPADTEAGEYSLYVTVTPSGTVVRLPLTVEAGQETGVVMTGLAASARCMGSNAYVAVTGVNGEALPIDVQLVTPFGQKQFTQVQPGKAAYQSFNTRQKVLSAGAVSVVASNGTGGEQTYELQYSALSCS